MITFQEFVTQNRPNDLQISFEDFVSTLESNGFEVKPTGRNREVIVREHSSDENAFTLWKCSAVNLGYGYGVVDKNNTNNMCFRLRFQEMIQIYNEDLYNRVIKLFGGDVSVSLPERVVEIPSPQWECAYCDGCDRAYIEVKQMFVSEARKAFDAYSVEVTKLFQ
jgi:hypothetical protein